MYYGIEQSTDMRDRRTAVRKFSSLSGLQKWIKNSARFTHDDPAGANNFHRTFRSGFELDGRIDKTDPIFKGRGTSAYPLSAETKKARHISQYVKEIE